MSVLFICSHNSARSQMAEAFARRLAGPTCDVASAGLEPRPIHPLTVTVMQAAGYTLEGHISKSLKQYLGKQAFTYVIMVCPSGEAQCPKLFPGTTKLLYWPFDDPAAAVGDETHRLAVFTRVRDEIGTRVAAWLASLSSPESIRD
jgi:arsenate reductase